MFYTGVLNNLWQDWKHRQKECHQIWIYDAQHKLALCIIPTQPDILELQHLNHKCTHLTHSHTHTMLECSQNEHNSKPQEPSKSWNQEQNLNRKQKHSRHQVHTHLHVLFLKAVGKPRPLNVLFVVVVAVPEGGKYTLPPTGQASSCHVQQMQPKLSEKNHNSRVRSRQKWCSLGRVTGTTLICHTTKEGFWEMT